MWANVVKADVPAPEVATDDGTSNVHERILVVDANAIISGIPLDRLGDRFFTTADVLHEIRDKKSRTFLSTLPYGVQPQEPNEEAVKAVLRFARQTGDIHCLSAADIKVLALAYMLEVQLYGAGHLREQPVAAKVKSRALNNGGRRLPGWGHVSNPEDWKVVDDAVDDATHHGSRITSVPQPLDSGGLNGFEAAAAAGAAGSAPSALVPPPPPEGVGASPAVLSSLQHPSGTAVGVAVQQEEEQEWSDDDDEDYDEDDDDGWNTAGKSRNADRRRERKQRGWEERQAARAAAARVTEPTAATSTSTTAPTPTTDASAVLQADSTTTAATATQGSDEPSHANTNKDDDDDDDDDDDEDDDGDDEEEEEDGENDDEIHMIRFVEGGDGQEGGADVAADSAEGEGAEGDAEEGGATSATVAATEEEEEEVPLMVNTTSRVSTLTADFPMQNMLLQMGLRLVAKDGSQITRLSRWALRCTACMFATKQAGRMFCPRCGNMTMERVEVTVGADGAEYFGVRKKHILRGTKYALPKPKGGKHKGGVADPILREDMMMLRMKKKMRRAQAKEAAIAAGEVDGLNPFTPEFGQDTWFQGQVQAGNKGVAHMMAGWKHNPNERKGQSHSNRRRK